jgi:CRP/FNR family cyclic AMP-dependent transcriptional regulator
MNAIEMELREPCAIFLTEHIAELNMGAGFLSRLNDQEQERVRSLGSLQTYKKHDTLFSQGEQHAGIWIIESGRVRTFYSGPNGREVTLAYWTPGHFVGGPEVFGEGRHIWSGDALETTSVLFMPGSAMRTLVNEIPSVAISIIDGLVAKGKCYSALIQMFGTRSATARLDRTITYEQLATMVGVTRQWVSATLENLQVRGILKLTRTQLQISSLESLRNHLDLQSST